MAIHEFSFPTRILFGPGALAQLPALLKAARVRRPLVITDRGLVSSEICYRLISTLSDAGFSAFTFSDISPNPTVPEVHAGGRACRDSSADAIVGFGGGSALDAAKAVRLLATHDGDVLSYEENAGGLIRPDMPVFIAIPTTAGTGSEVGRSTVITDPTHRVKKVIFSPHLLATTVIADPELTLGLPPHLTAATGMDAFTHCIEAYLARGYHPLCDSIALGGIRLIDEHLPRAVRDGSDLEARGHMLMAAMMGAVAFQKGLGVTHSLAHPLTTVAGLHHGLANGILLASALEFNLPVAAQRLADIAQALRLAPGGTRDEQARAAIERVRALASEIGIPPSLSAAGVTADMIGPMTEQAAADGCHQLNPRSCSPAELRGLYEEAMKPS
ncbi:MAG: iron-containing alcohol dehydrogenase [Candidatus Wallbacteria bacterium]|nr:iron-containing alcohol dehydrogenase [Candidatus Wallbacteria bacterium]